MACPPAPWRRSIVSTSAGQSKLTVATAAGEGLWLRASRAGRASTANQTGAVSSPGAPAMNP